MGRFKTLPTPWEGVNRMSKRYYSLERRGRDVDIEIYGDICEYKLIEADTSSFDLAQQVKDLTDVDNIIVGINSYGGEVKEGLAIYNALKQSKAKVTTRCDGFACSAASIVFCAGTERIMNEASLLMIHNAWSRVEGDAKAMRKEADDLEKITEPSIRAYLSVSNIEEDELRAMMDAETWIDPDEALEMGFATSVVKSKTDKASQSVRKKLFQLIKQAGEDSEEEPEEEPTEEPSDEEDAEDTEPTEEPEDEPEEEPEDPDSDSEGNDGRFRQFLKAITN